MAVNGKVVRIDQDKDVVGIAAKVSGVSDEVAVTKSTPGFDLLSGAKVGQKVRVEVELIPPRTSTLAHLNIIKIVRGVDKMIVTEGMVKEAIALVRPTAQMMLKTKGLTWGPKFVDGTVRVRGLRAIGFRYGIAPEIWNEKWGEVIDFVKIANGKRRLSERGKANTSFIFAAKRWILREGDYLYPAGGVYHDGIAVGVSGAEGWVDEAIGEMIASTIIMLANLETEKRLKAGEDRITRRVNNAQTMKLTRVRATLPSYFLFKLRLMKW